MAQCTGGTSFDLAFERKHDVVLRLLTRAADLWATQGREALPPDSLVAVMLRIFLSEWSGYGGRRGEMEQEMRTLDAWIALVGTPSEEADPLTAPPSEQISSAISQLVIQVSSGADQWSMGNPEQPPTPHVLNAVEHILFSHKLTHPPPNPKLPCSVRMNE